MAGVAYYATRANAERRRVRRARLARVANTHAAASAAPALEAPPPPAVPVASTSSPISGLSVDENGIRVQDWGRWVPFAQKTLRQAIALGMFHPEAILTYVMEVGHPEYQWPPPQDSLLRVDWNGMLSVLSSQFHPDPLPETRPQLRVVT